MQIEYYDYTCILIKDSNGKRILMNPLNFIPIKDKYDITPNIITLSNPYTKYSFDNSYEKIKVINSVTQYQDDNFKIEGILSYNDDICGLKRGENIIYKIQLDNYSIAHLGNIGHLPTPEIINKLSNIDILILPIGGNFFLNGYTAFKLTSILKTKFVIPIGFSKFNNNLMLSGASYFIRYFRNVIVSKSNKIHSLDLTYNGDTIPVILNSKV